MKKILVITLSNIGDVVLTFPVLDILKRDYPQANISVVVGPKAETLLHQNPHFDSLYIFDKQQSTKETLKWISELRKEKFDLVIDLRNTAIPLLIGAKKRVSLLSRKAPFTHMKEKHLNRLRLVHPFSDDVADKKALYFSDEDQHLIDNLLKESRTSTSDIVVMAPGAADQIKRWTEDGFAKLSDHFISHFGFKVVFVGDNHDQSVAERIKKKMKQNEAINICGKTNLIQLACAIDRCFLAIVNDSSPMHLASYLNKPVVALFSKSDPKKYGPWSDNAIFLKSKEVCRSCEDPSKQLKHTCMETLSYETVIQAIQIEEQNVILK